MAFIICHTKSVLLETLADIEAGAPIYPAIIRSVHFFTVTSGPEIAIT